MFLSINDGNYDIFSCTGNEKDDIYKYITSDQFKKKQVSIQKCELKHLELPCKAPCNTLLLKVYYEDKITSSCLNEQ